MSERKNHGENLEGKGFKAGVVRQMPKNLRQIGKIGDGLRIYVEDYVKTYVKQLEEQQPEGVSVAILVGEYIRMEKERCVFVYGAIQLERVYENGKIHFSEETWTSIYETIKHYFPDGEIAGWCVGGMECTGHYYDMLRTVHLDNFAGRDKLLFHYDAMEKDGEFFCYESGELRLQSGYFIYYDKNEVMQDYMIDHKQVKREEQYVEDRAVREFRNMYQEKHPAEQKKVGQPVLKLMYATGIVIVLVVLSIGVTAMNNHEKMKGLEETLQAISNSLTNESSKTADNGTNETTPNIFENVTGNKKGEDTPESVHEENQLPVETEAGGVSPLPTEHIVMPTEEITPTLIPTPTHEAVKEPTNEPTKVPTKEPVKPAEAENTDSSLPVFTADQLTKYTVKSGDTLAGICYRLYGTAKQMKVIQQLNEIEDENKIFAGQKLTVPKE